MYAYIFLIAISFVWGLSFPLTRNVLGSSSVSYYLAARFLTGSVVLAALFFPRIIKAGKALILKSMLLGFLLFGLIVLISWSFYYTTAANVSFISGLFVVIVPIISHFYLKKPTNKIIWIGIFLSVIGLFFLSGGVGFKFNIGDFLSLLSTVFASWQIILIDKFIETEDPIDIGIWQIFFCALFSLIYLFFDVSAYYSLDRHFIIGVSVTGVFCTAVAFVVQSIVQKYISPSHVVLIFGIEPVIGAAFSALIPKPDGTFEAVTFNMVIGCVFIMAGMLLAVLFREKKPSASL